MPMLAHVYHFFEWSFNIIKLKWLFLYEDRKENITVVIRADLLWSLHTQDLGIAYIKKKRKKTTRLCFLREFYMKFARILQREAIGEGNNAQPLRSPCEWLREPSAPPARTPDLWIGSWRHVSISSNLSTTKQFEQPEIKHRKFANILMSPIPACPFISLVPLFWSPLYLCFPPIVCPTLYAQQ